MHRTQKPTTPPGFGRSLLLFTFVIGVSMYAFLSFVVKHNPAHLIDAKPALACAILIMFFSFSATRATGLIKHFLLLLLLLIALALGGFTVYLQRIALQLKAPFSEFLIASLVAVGVSFAGSWFGRFLFLRGARKSGVVLADPEDSLPGPTRFEWISYDRKLNGINHGAIDIAAAKRIVDQYIKQAKPHYENGEDAIVETFFRICQSPDTFLDVSINGPNNMSVTLQVERRDVPSLIRFFRGHFVRELTLTSRNELLALVEAFFEITPDDFMPRFKEWSTRQSKG